MELFATATSPVALLPAIIAGVVLPAINLSPVSLTPVINHVPDFHGFHDTGN
jgi:hypothetical protein